MEITKLEHACLVVRQDGAALVVDPGNYTRPVEVDGLVGIIVTHEHPDHLDPTQLRRLLDRAPDVPVLGPAGVAAALRDSMPDVDVDVVTDGDSRSVGPFALSFHGTRHAVIHSSVPVVDNTGVMIDGRFFSPGDAYTDPGVPVEVLAVPVGAPWLKVGEMMDYVAALRPERTFPVHEQTLSEAGFAQGAMRIAQMTEPAGEALVLRPGDTLTL